MTWSFIFTAYRGGKKKKKKDINDTIDVKRKYFKNLNK